MGGVTSQHPKLRQVLDPRADLTGQRTILKSELPNLTPGGADQTELKLKRKAALPGENNSSDHPS
jgi:hypothetical protein